MVGAFVRIMGKKITPEETEARRGRIINRLNNGEKWDEIAKAEQCSNAVISRISREIKSNEIASPPSKPPILTTDKVTIRFEQKYPIAQYENRTLSVERVVPIGQMGAGMIDLKVFCDKMNRYLCLLDRIERFYQTTRLELDKDPTNAELAASLKKNREQYDMLVKKINAIDWGVQS